MGADLAIVDNGQGFLDADLMPVGNGPRVLGVDLATVENGWRGWGLLLGITGSCWKDIWLGALVVRLGPLGHVEMEGKASPQVN